MSDSGQAANWKTVQQLCEEIGITIQIVRNLQAQFPEHVTLTERNGEKGFTPETAEILRQIVTARQRGWDDEQIRSMLTEHVAVESDEDDVENVEKLLQKIDSLSLLLERQEKRQSEERDRLMMVLMRTQQEIQSLRYEVAATRSRRDRKRPWWKFGRRT